MKTLCSKNKFDKYYLFTIPIQHLVGILLFYNHLNINNINHQDKRTKFVYVKIRIKCLTITFLKILKLYIILQSLIYVYYNLKIPYKISFIILSHNRFLFQFIKLRLHLLIFNLTLHKSYTVNYYRMCSLIHNIFFIHQLS